MSGSVTAMRDVFKTDTLSRAFVYDPFDAVIELAILEREVLARIQARMAAQQCGEAFEGLDTYCRSS